MKACFLARPLFYSLWLNWANLNLLPLSFVLVAGRLTRSSTLTTIPPFAVSKSLVGVSSSYTGGCDTTLFPVIALVSSTDFFCLATWALEKLKVWKRPLWATFGAPVLIYTFSFSCDSRSGSLALWDWVLLKRWSGRFVLNCFHGFGGWYFFKDCSLKVISRHWCSCFWRPEKVDL